MLRIEDVAELAVELVHNGAAEVTCVAELDGATGSGACHRFVGLILRWQLKGNAVQEADPRSKLSRQIHESDTEGRFSGEIARAGAPSSRSR